MHLIGYVVVLASVLFGSMTISLAAQIPNVDASTAYEGESAAVNLYFSQLPQGRAGLISVSGSAVEHAEIQVFGRATRLFRTDEGVHYGFVSAPIEQAIRRYEAFADVTYTDGSTESIRFPLDVVSGNFIQQTVLLINNGEDELLNPEIESQELQTIFELAAPVSDDALWGDQGFIAPISGELTSPFGAVRVFNDTYRTLHTGWDFNARLGDPMVSMAGGRVVFAGLLPIRGHYILIDHGWGIYSGYAHLSLSYVTQGQRVYPGQVIGRVGSTGRSTSAHAHVEMIANGNWVDVADFLKIFIRPAAQ